MSRVRENAKKCGDFSRRTPKPTRDTATGLHPDGYFRAAHAPLRHRVAGVAVPALPIGVHVLAEVVENEARAALRGLTVLHHSTQLRAILDATRLVVGEIGAEIDGGHPLIGQSLPAPAAVLAHEPM